MKKLGAWLVVGWVACVQVSVAERYSFVGHRAQGMGGANAASVNDSSAQWQNPAAFGFFNREADEVPGLQTNVVSNLVVEVEQTSVTNEVSTNVVETVMVTNEVPTEVVETGTNGVPVTNTVMEAQVAELSVTNSMMTPEVVMVPVTNQYYTYTNEVVDIMVVPDRARVDNMKLEENDWGWNILGFGVGYTMTEDMPEYVTALGEIDFDSFDGGGLDGLPSELPGQVDTLLQLSSVLYGLGSDPDNSFYVDATAGMNFRFGNFGVGVRGFAEAAGFIDYLDTQRFGVEQSLAEFNTALDDAALEDGFSSVGYTYESINPGDLSASGIGADQEAYVDYKLTQLKQDGYLSDALVDDAVEMVNLLKFGEDPDDVNSDSFENNQSTVTARGFGLLEVPFSYGHAFNDQLSIGITAKAMYGTVTGTKIRFANGDAFEDSLDNMEENTEASFNFGLDLGVLYRMKMLQFGAVAHNINAPTFDGFSDQIQLTDENGDPVGAPIDITVPDYTIDPQVTLGAAFIPSKRFMVEMSYDLLETGTLMKNYDIQRLSFGAELDVWLLALRLGAYNNLAADWQDWIATGGLGINLWAMRFDIGGAYSIGANAEYEGTEIPEEARLYAALSMEF
ncbi:conjugal transfer protein TraF [Pontiella sp.]|uniref:conjugal transfer protein TraF n=1 Tax=Pontiella sp. TaxID=2837462 RepID=UPI00356554BE